MVAGVSPKKVSIVHAYLDVASARRPIVAAPLLDRGREVVWLDDDTKLAAALPEIRVLACGGLPALDFSGASALALVQVLGAGIDHLDTRGLPSSVRIANARGIHGGEIRDHALAMMLTFARDLPRVLDLQARRRWAPFAAGTLRGRTLGVLGLGEIGRSIAKAGRALGMHVIGTRIRDEVVADVHQTLAPSETRSVLARADYVVVCLPLTDATRGLLSENMLAELRPAAVLINISRGGILDEDALRRMLEAGTLRGAALDVFAEEPLPESSELWSTPHLILSPHMAGRAHDYLERAFTVLEANVQRLESGLPLLTPVDVARGY